MATERERVIAGRYRLRQRLGAGGGGSVWLAEDDRLRAQVAVKEIDVPPEPDPAIGDLADRGRNEALKAAQLREHPNVITVYDVVEHDDRPWIVMEYLPGTRDLRAVVKERGPLSSEETARIGAAALDGLGAGHRLGIIHRDVKPSNILLAPDHSGTEDGRVLLTDYGISLRPRETRVTQSGMVVGTPGYVAPERLSGGEATADSDLFSLGVTLYYAVEGTGPFERDTLDAALLAVLTTEPSVPQRASDPLGRVIMGLLAKDPQDRWDAERARDLLAEAAGGPDASGAGVPDTAAGPAHSASPAKAPATPAGRLRGGPGRRAPALLALAATLAGGAGFALGAAVFHDAGEGARQLEVGAKAAATPTPMASPTPAPTVTRSAYPYGRQAGLRDALAAGQCVDADWKGGTYQGRAGIKAVDCDDDPEGQVIATVAQSVVTAADVEAVRGECTRRTAELRASMPDPVLYVLTPETGQGEPPDSACLLFLKNATLGGPIGDFRKFGDEVFITQLGAGDCINSVEDDEGSSTETLVSCDRPHDEQVVGWTWASGEGSSDSVDTGSLCEEKYGVNWARGQGHEMWGWTSSDEWDDGFRHVMCSVARDDEKKLPGGVLKPAY
ncbi:serine/threonine protein kinase [Streptomyces lincolnensis]|uniref:serine/threonine-protein kinase n=1 Tax=Streptomyces lincolnensis TaxID=1915 RepID=UPI000DF5EF60|nr:serine/threonine-protein kinase [Streptomyces lincolnensis]AXG52198.1 serine/threonine protein kinase [Streptomyces lincolnensis]